MQIYSHVLNLRLWHPTLDPDLVTRTLGLEPQIAWRAGDSRKTPKGTLLEGVRSEGYWSADPFSYGWRESADAQIEDALEELITLLEPHRDFLQGVTQGGFVRVWVSSHSNRNFSLELSPGMLARLASLGATFVHDVYQGP
ncbi:MAG: DUF4279 domain-containing protein [Lysobacteraceae bacterium]|nr:MAG: DUF4279 domain-containing protein [Xanthomonadaceae bacterium]